ncbi:MAG: hypothetical protein RMJ57_02995 [Bacteroidia bacterium]|nr:hypothetical protein [Bacteroidia bacterium]
MKESTMQRIWKLIKSYHQTYLQEHGVELPSLRKRDSTYTKDALILRSGSPNEN